MPRVTAAAPSSSRESWKYSTFFVTVNTNTREYDKAKLKSVLTRIFSDDDMFYGLFEGTGLDTFDRDYSSVRFTVEVGPKLSLVHSHILIKTRHKGHVKINIPLFTEVLRKALSLSGINVNVRASGDTAARLQDYIEKAPSV
jgi:hypothetical protein